MDPHLLRGGASYSNPGRILCDPCPVCASFFAFWLLPYHCLRNR